MNYTYLKTVLLSLVLLTGCNNKAPKDTNNNDTPTSENALKKCTGANKGFDTATFLRRGERLQSSNQTSSIRLWHLEDGKRKACTISGDAGVL